MNIAAQITYHGVVGSPAFIPIEGPYNVIVFGEGKSATAAYTDAVCNCLRLRGIDLPSLDRVLPETPVCLPVEDAEAGVHVVSIKLSHKKRY